MVYLKDPRTPEWGIGLVLDDLDHGQAAPDLVGAFAGEQRPNGAKAFRIHQRTSVSVPAAARTSHPARIAGADPVLQHAVSGARAGNGASFVRKSALA